MDVEARTVFLDLKRILLIHPKRRRREFQSRTMLNSMFAQNHVRAMQNDTIASRYVTEKEYTAEFGITCSREVVYFVPSVMRVLKVKIE